MLTELEQSADREARHAAHDLVTELEAKLAKAVEGIKSARGFSQVTHIHATLDATLAELTGGKDD